MLLFEFKGEETRLSCKTCSPESIKIIHKSRTHPWNMNWLLEPNSYEGDTWFSLDEVGSGLVLPQLNVPSLVLPFLRSKCGVGWGGAEGEELGRVVEGGGEYMIMSKKRQKLCLVSMTRSDSTHSCTNPWSNFVLWIRKTWGKI